MRLPVIIINDCWEYIIELEHGVYLLISWGSVENRRALCPIINVFTGNSKMTAALLLPVLKSQPKSVNLSHKGLKKIPSAIGQLTNVLRLELQGNKIKSLPVEFGNLVQVSVQVINPTSCQVCLFTLLVLSCYESLVLVLVLELERETHNMYWSTLLILWSQTVRGGAHGLDSSLVETRGGPVIPVIPCYTGTCPASRFVMSLAVGMQGQKAYGLCTTPLCAVLVVQFFP